MSEGRSILLQHGWIRDSLGGSMERKNDGSNMLCREPQANRDQQAQDDCLIGRATV